jgi:DNA modification methylase
LDPFAGSGTTGIEALKLGRQFVGMEIAQEYYDLMNKELADLQALSNLILPVTVDKNDSVDQNKLENK